MHYSVSFPQGNIQYLLNTAFNSAIELCSPKDTIIITDKNIAAFYASKFQEYKAVIEIKAGEQSKNTETVHYIIDQLLKHEVHRKSFLLGVGGGMVTDITGYVASTYMRGINFGFAPTSLLGMVDAAIGGKNGINYQLQKNLIGTISQPSFILFDRNFLDTLPDDEWSNGFAEIIKYACLFDEGLFNELHDRNIEYYKKNNAALASLISKCVDWKNKIVLTDEHEHGKRKILNFGHTAGHAFETIARIPHGQAVGLGMLVACALSQSTGLTKDVYHKLKHTLGNYNLPTEVNCDIDQTIEVITMDKKRNNDGIDFVLLNTIGKSTIKNTSIKEIKAAIEIFINESNY